MFSPDNMSSQREADLQNDKRSVYIVRGVCMMTLHCELLLTLAKQTRPVLAHVTPDNRSRSALPLALLAQLSFPVGAACWKSWLQMFQLISLRDPLEHTSTQFFFPRAEKLLQK